MQGILCPLSVVFVWHPSDKEEVQPIISYCAKLLSRNIEKPFSRSINLPMFYFTTFEKGVPSNIEIESEKIIIFTFISKNIVADPQWESYIDGLCIKENNKVIGLALDQYAFNINAKISEDNFIRLSDFKLNKNEKVFISIAHEIYRYCLNEKFSQLTRGKDNSLKLFLSHAKDGKNGIKLAKKLKEFIDNSQMRNFFDATDIAIGYKFDNEIIEYIKDSSVILIHSDIYSSRYWCQKEIMTAKKNERPLIAVNVVEEFDDRSFPFASNVPEMRIKIDDISEIDLLRILITVLLETIRFFYSRKLLTKYFNDDNKTKICCRPPEVADIDKLLFKAKDKIKLKYERIIYPEPPVYSEEVEFLRNLGVEVCTPLTAKDYLLKNKKIGISISELSESELISIGQDHTHLTRLSQDIARHLIAKEGKLVYGGDLRPNGFTEFIFNEVEVVKSRLNIDDIYLYNYISWPIYIKNNEELTLWKAKYRKIAKMIEMPLLNELKDLVIDEETFLIPDTTQNMYVWSKSLTEMRNKMIDDCDIRICAGGRYFGYKGIMPGVLEEFLIALDKEKPIYLLGGFGGVTEGICKLIEESNSNEKFTEEWQIENNIGYKQLLEFYNQRDEKNKPDYKLIEYKIKNANLNNGLSEEENHKLFTTTFIDEAIYLVLRGIYNVFN